MGQFYYYLKYINSTVKIKYNKAVGLTSTLFNVIRFTDFQNLIGVRYIICLKWHSIVLPHRWMPFLLYAYLLYSRC